MYLCLLAGVAVAATAAWAKPEQLRTDQSPVYHLYLQAHPQNASLPVLGPIETSEYFNIGSTIQSANTSRYLNIAGESTSYKALTLDTAATTKSWQLEGDTIITSTSSSYGRQLNFLVCQLNGGFWEVYLQTGSATPSGKTCTDYLTLHLPCLC